MSRYDRRRYERYPIHPDTPVDPRAIPYREWQMRNKIKMICYIIMAILGLIFFICLMVLF